MKPKIFRITYFKSGESTGNVQYFFSSNADEAINNWDMRNKDSNWEIMFIKEITSDLEDGEATYVKDTNKIWG
ncbi:hypothetical protein B7C51_25060 (plasmid) [Paenibacillus larvae subsp. pulvifaciens]|uniref:Uncharacterized protein n=1 Tax=Paenibacillus larvae subsp. pulvifaciens TaxID=1477 RepID=A0A1V0UZX5_9BACL|nr:hypothetical protein [Paenibacillus larvae]ARF70744.1 hypothetical protein B7C51_25060 [Paenibacillus larvae subsp. pulvifaciens]